MKIEPPKPNNATLTVGQATIEPDMIHPQVAIIRYAAIMFCIFILTAVSGWRLGWSLSVVLIVFAATSLLAIVSITLIETKQIQGLVNSVLDYWLNGRRLHYDNQVTNTYLEAAQMLDFYELRHKQLLEKQAFILNNQVKIWEIISRSGGNIEGQERALIESVAKSAKPGGFVDTLIEDQIAEALTSYIVTLFDVDKKGERFRITEDGEILEAVPWEENGPMTEKDREIALQIFQTIASRKSPVVEKLKGSGWRLNVDSYARPIDAIRAFDTVYE